MATERVTLYGLPIVPGRTVGYDRVDAEHARELFIDHALVRGEWETRHGFVAANEAFMDEARALGDRLRRADLFDHDETLFRFYDRRVGDRVVSGRHFDRWWKGARRDDPDLLTLGLADLVGDDPDLDLAGHPDVWRQGELVLPVTYRFDPDDDLDGATVHIPLALLDRVEPWDFDWQIPAYRRELVRALVATVPKAVRRDLPPLAATAAEVAARIRFQERPLVEAVADELRAVTGGRIAPADLDIRRVPPHLRLTFAVDDDDGTTLAYGKDLDAVRRLVGPRVRRAVAAAVASAAPGIERSGLTAWPGGDLPRLVRSEPDPAVAAGNVVEGHPALIDEGGTVAVRVLSRPDAAERATAAGIRRLVLLAVPVGVRGLEREIPDPVRRALVALPEITVGALLRDVVTAAATTVVARHGGVTWTEAGFAARVAGARSDLRDTASGALRGAGKVLVAAAEVAPALDRLTAPTLAASVADAREHLGRLVRPGFVGTAGTARLDDVDRYVRGIGVRLEKLPVAPARDAARLAEVVPLERSYGQLLGALAPTQVTPRVVAAGWLLEELRVSLFAQSLGARVPVSPRRVAAELEALWSGELD